MNKLEVVKGPASACLEIDATAASPGITEWDEAVYRGLVSEKLTPEQIEQAVKPPRTYPRQEAVLAVHWHPEFLPMDVIMRRVDALYPNRKTELIIPTQHNVLMSLNGYSGVEVDCYSHGFNRKVQLLLHFKEEKVAQADTLKCMLNHTFQYRSSQLFEYLDAIIDPAFEDRLQRAAAETGASEELVEFTRLHARKLKLMLEKNEAATPPEAIKNKLVRNYFDALLGRFDQRVIQRAQALLTAVKRIVKENFSLSYFYRTSEIIEEARGLGAGVVVPHPEQFWPILLADYDVDGYEVWNPQSQEYTEFLVNVVHRKNKARRDNRELLVFMGDDCHMSEKLKAPDARDQEKAGREIGLQPAWDDPSIRKSVLLAGVTRRKIIDEYKSRLA